jgi:hypothetical protein
MLQGIFGKETWTGWGNFYKIIHGGSKGRITSLAGKDQLQAES